MTKTQAKLYKNVLILGTILIFIAYIIFNRSLNIIFSAATPLIFALVLFYLFKPLVRIFSKKLNHTLSVWLTFIIAAIVLAGVIFSLVPAISISITSLIDVIKSTTAEDFLGNIERTPFISDYFDTSSMEAFTETLLDVLNKYVSNIFSYTTNIISTVSSWFVKLFLYLLGVLMAFYLLKDSDHNAVENTELFIRSMLPEKIAALIVRVAKLTDACFKKYLIGKLYASAVFGLLVFIVSLLINMFTPLSIPYLPLLAFLIAIGNLIPYIGSIIATIPCILLCLFTGVWEAIVFLAIVLLIQAFDNIIITPKIVGDKIGLKPFWVLVGITVVGSITGSMIGMILSVPIIAVILTLVEEQMDNFREKMTEIAKKLYHENEASEDKEDENKENIVKDKAMVMDDNAKEVKNSRHLEKTNKKKNKPET